MKITRKQLREIISEITTRDPDELERSKEAIAGSPPAVKYDDWLLELMNILNIEKPDNIPDITTYDAHQNNMSPRRYADLIGEPQESEQERIQNLEKQTSADVGEMDDEFEAFLKAVESGKVIDLDDRR
tara:strand:- start:620 stop:1006 length:387 start_codon:yes stop_codon:yes gene_type:complete